MNTGFEYVWFSAYWMAWNVLLAFVPVAVAYFMRWIRGTIFELCALSVWLLFLPNTIYMVTDGMYVFGEEFGNMHLAGMLLGVVLYATVIALAPYTYYLALFPIIEKYKKKINKLDILYKLLLVFCFSFLISLGVTMGRFARTNSWYVFTNPFRIIGDVFHVFVYWESLLFLLAFTVGLIILNYIVFRNAKNYSSKA